MFAEGVAEVLLTQPKGKMNPMAVAHPYNRKSLVQKEGWDTDSCYMAGSQSDGVTGKRTDT